MSSTVAGKTYLVTGGASLIGSHLTDVMLAEGAAEVRLLDNLALGSLDTIRHLAGEPRVKRITGDILRLEELIDAADGADGIFALAAFLTLPMSQRPALGVAVNSVGMVNTLEAARIARVRRVVFSSSISAYGSAMPQAMTEDTGFVSTGLTPASRLYSTSKLMGEALCEQYAKSYGLQYNALRFSSVYGERQHARAVNAVFIAEAYEHIRRGERPVIVGDGSEVHDYIYVTDIAQACHRAMTSGSHNHILNICTGVDTTLNRVVEILQEVCDARHLAPQHRPDTRTVRSSSVSRLGLTRQRAEAELGWVPTVPIEEGIRRYVAWRQRNA